MAQYAAVKRDIALVQASALAALAGQVGGDVLLVNPTSFSRNDPAFLSGEFSGGFVRNGQPLITQKVEGGVLVNAGELPPYSIVPLTHIEEISTIWHDETPLQRVLENDYLRVEFNPNGDVTRIYDKLADREVLPVGEVANQFQMFEDRPKDFDAWDIDLYYEEKKWLAEPAVSIRWVETGPLRQTIEIKRNVLSSSVTQRISLTHNGPRLDFDTVIQWNERHMLLKVAFPVDVLAAEATYEIQWGNVQRSTHRNTSWDWARFETCAHKWADLSEGDYGVSLLNDCKYGYDIHKNVMRLTLLRSPSYPDPFADAGEHHFKYSLLPHSGGWKQRTQAEAYALNDPLIVFQTHQQEPLWGENSFVSGLPPNVIIETIKLAEDGDDIILRLYESQRMRSLVRSGLPFLYEKPGRQICSRKT